MEIIFATCGCHAATNLIPDAVAHSLIAFCLSIYVVVVVVVRGQKKKTRFECNTQSHKML